ncbi:energy transducer TonB [Niabella sp.]|uniref:energy transducer TonB n=1 Tax=Niabella sp. TaxID=1962976 RepID=UPI002612505D|nr:energy transducer TonB [Niabella sp.]
MKTILTAFLILLLSLPVNAQQKWYSYYFDANLSPTDKEHALVYGKGVKQDSVVWVDFLLTANNQKIFSAAYTDSSLSILHGISIDYYKNGRVQQVKRYVYNVQEGVTQKWDEKGRQTDSMLYAGGVVVFKKQFRYFRENTILNETITDSIHNTLQYINYDTTGRKTREFAFWGNKGIEKIFHADGTVTNGDSLYSREDKDASFPGGLNAWASYLTRTLDAAVPIRKGAFPGQYRVIIQFVIDKEGNISDIKALTNNGYGMEDEAIRVIRNSGKWIPAQQYGRAIKAYRKQPIIFTITQQMPSTPGKNTPRRYPNQEPSGW